MLNKFKKIFGASLMAFIMLFSFAIVYSSLAVNHVVYAVDIGGQGDQNDEDPLPQDQEITTLKNPIETIETIPEFVKAILNIVLIIGVPIIALAIIYTGFLFVKAQGKPEELKKAKDAFTYVLIGAAILLASYVIAEAIQGTINNIRGTQTSMIETIDESKFI